MFNIKRFEEQSKSAGSGGDKPNLGTQIDAPPKDKSINSLLEKAKKRFTEETDNKEKFDIKKEKKRKKTAEKQESKLLEELAPTLLRSFQQLHQTNENVLKKSKDISKKRQRRKTSKKLEQEGSKLPQKDSSLEADAEQWNLNHVLVRNLQAECNVKEFFGVQKKTINRILTSSVDVCIAAPTGSGKTLAFVIPVVQSLIDRVVKRLRCLVLLPTRDLALQVKNVFEKCCLNTGLSVGFSSGQSPFETDQKSLVCSDSGESKVDILVATPGRLIEHLRYTESFTLEHLRYLVVDEADRLLSQSYQDWLTKIHSAAFRGTKPQVTWDKKQIKFNPATVRRRFGTTLNSHRNEEVVLRRILCSATLSDNPQTMAALGLSKPIYIIWNGRKQEVTEENEFRFSLPSTLDVFMVKCTEEDKPLALIHLLKTFQTEKTLIFTRSVEATHRLYLVLNFYGNLGVGVGELSSNQNPKERALVIKKFSEGKISVLVSSDIMTRGIDIEDLKNVVNYDIPPYVKTLVHRAGRTARAGKKGKCYGLVRSDQGRHFRQMLSELQIKPQFMKVEDPDINPYRETYEDAIQKMKEAITA